MHPSNDRCFVITFSSQGAMSPFQVLELCRDILAVAFQEKQPAKI
jgi:hypothetical protein